MTDRHAPGYKRPPRPSPRAQITLSPDHWAWLDAQGGRSETIRTLIDAQMKEETNGQG